MERIVTDPAGLKVQQQLIALTDAAGNVIDPRVTSGGIEDLLYIDDSGTQFIYRDNGATPPVFTAYRIPQGTVYTVGSNPVPYAVKNTIVSNTTTVPANVQIASLYYPSSTGNNTSAQLAAAATFTGAIETVLSLQAAQIEVVCDQAYTLVVNQYIDAAGTQKSGSRTYTKLAGVPTNINVLLPGNYFNLTLTNNGGSATTTLAINTTFGIMDSVDDTGRLMVNTPQAGPYTGQLLVTGTAQALPARALLNGLVFRASDNNSGKIVFGPAGLNAAVDGSGNGDILSPGEKGGSATDEASKLYFRLATGNSSATDFISYSGN